MHITPEALEPEFTLATAATRLDFLSRRDDGSTELNTVVQDDDDSWLGVAAADTSLDVHEALELLALGEVIARKAHGSRLIGIRAALRGGADWEDIAAALGGTAEEAWDDFVASITGELDVESASAARELAGTRPGRLSAPVRPSKKRFGR